MSLYHPARSRLTLVKPSDILIHSNDAEKSTGSTTYVMLKEIVNGIDGCWRVGFDLRSSGGYTARGIIYRNGSSYGTERATTSTSYVTFTEDLYFSRMDKIQLYARIYSTPQLAYVRNFRLYGDIIDAVAHNTLT
jgi:hypothetical protein